MTILILLALFGALVYTYGCFLRVNLEIELALYDKVKDRYKRHFRKEYGMELDD